MKNLIPHPLMALAAALGLALEAMADKSFAVLSPDWLGQPLAGSKPVEFSNEGQLPVKVSFELKDGKITGIEHAYFNTNFEECMTFLKQQWGEPSAVIAPGQMVVWRPTSFRGTVTLFKGEKKRDGIQIIVRKFIVIGTEE